MIDFHTHILPRIDDGAADEKTALQMLDIAFKQDIKTIVFTPHYYGNESVEDFLQKRQSSFAKIQQNIPKGINTFLGAEVHFNGTNIYNFDKLKELTISNTRYILIEFPFIERWSSALTQKLFTFMEQTDCIPILAHIERYAEVRNNPKLVSKLVEAGCLMQVNASSFLDKRDKRFAFALLKKGLVHCIGSDTHNVAERISQYDKTKEIILKAGFEEEWNIIQNTMKVILQNGPVFVREPSKVKKIFSFYL